MPDESEDPQHAEKQRIKEWLKKNNHSREWLGDGVGVAHKTARNWLSSRQEIPQGKLTLIQRLMEEDEAAETRRRLQLLPQAQIFSLEVDLPTFRAYSAAALASRQTLEQWAIAELNAAAEAGTPASTFMAELNTAASAAARQIDEANNEDERAAS